MAIDPSIYSQIRPVQRPSLADDFTQMLQLKDLVTESKAHQLQLQQGQQAFQEAQIVREAFRQAGGDPTKVRDLLQKSGQVSPAMMNTITTLTQHIANLGDEKLRRQALESAADEKTRAIASEDVMKILGAPAENQAGVLTQVWSRHPEWPDPQQLQQEGKLQDFLVGTALSKSIHEHIVSAAEETRKNAAETRAATEATQKTTEFNNKQAQEASGTMMPGTEFTNEKQERAAIFRVRQADGTYKNEMRVLGQQAAPQRPLNEQTAQQWLKDNPGKTLTDYDKYKQDQRVQTAAAGAAARQDLMNKPVEIAPDSKEFRIAQDLAYGKLTYNAFRSLYPTRAGSMQIKPAIYDKARELNPNFNPAAFEMGYKFASNPKVQQQLASMDNVLAAVPDLLQLSDNATRTGIKKLNDLIIQGGIQLSGKKYSNLATARTAFADELSGALGFGSATDMSRQMGIDMTQPDLSPDAFRSQIETVVVPFIQRKKESLLKPMGVYGQPGMNPEAGPSSSSTTSTRLTATNKKTGEQIESTDGGQTWHKLQK